MSYQNKAKEEHRYYPKTPRLGVGVLVVNDNKLLLIKRGQEPAKGEWSIPGGLVEIGETLAQAAHREVMEECHIHISHLQRLDLFEYIEKDVRNNIKYHYIVVDYLAEFAGGKLAAASDIDAACWVALEDIGSMKCSQSIKKLVHQANKFLKSTACLKYENDPKIK
ncbi:NUDIX domain-containing protein [candidate division KSB1 bacterium]|nr:NUDIX hydrolase [candidate division KSB1 bacterium]RQW05213.1 MAG: NUDIX domain-containing protein [candidate division KSB1 bacterium]